jgi:HAD superfamily hydrolase (TIGR01509 family)
MTLPDREFDGYIFDCDGTLTDNMPLHFKAWTRAMEDFGGQFPEALFYQWGGRPTAVIVASLNEQFGLTLDPDRVVERKEFYYEQMIPEVVPFEPVVGFLRSVRGRAKVSVASGGHRHLVVGTLRALGIDDVFDAIVTAEDYERGKPAPDPFLLAAKLMDVPPSRCCVFEDSPTGIAAAEAAGMEHVLVSTGLRRA